MVIKARRCEVDRCNKFALSIKNGTVWQCKPHYYDSIRSEPMPKFMKKLMDL